MKRRLILITLTVVLVGLYAAGPRVEIDTTLGPADPPADLSAWLATSESAFADLVPGTEKLIVRLADDTVRTPLSIVYLHGFSSSRQETAPLSDSLAARLRATLYYVRFTGHGRTGEALAAATVNDWLNDANVAVEIGRRLGDRVIVIATSTGATIATWLAAQPQFADVAAWIFISPNYGPANRASEILLWPWGGQIARVLLGPERSWIPQNELQALYWTERYPVRALLPMMGTVALARRAEVDAIRSPVLILYSPNDQVVDPGRTEAMAERFGSPTTRIEAIESPADPDRHVLAGDILAPGDTRDIVARIMRFIEAAGLAR